MASASRLSPASLASSNDEAHDDVIGEQLSGEQRVFQKVEGNHHVVEVVNETTEDETTDRRTFGSIGLYYTGVLGMKMILNLINAVTIIRKFLADPSERNREAVSEFADVKSEHGYAIAWSIAESKVVLPSIDDLPTIKLPLSDLPTTGVKKSTDVRTDDLTDVLNTFEKERKQYAISEEIDEKHIEEASDEFTLNGGDMPYPWFTDFAGEFNHHETAEFFMKNVFVFCKALFQLTELSYYKLAEEKIDLQECINFLLGEPRTVIHHKDLSSLVIDEKKTMNFLPLLERCTSGMMFLQKQAKTFVFQECMDVVPSYKKFVLEFLTLMKIFNSRVSKNTNDNKPQLQNADSSGKNICHLLLKHGGGIISSKYHGTPEQRTTGVAGVAGKFGSFREFLRMVSNASTSGASASGSTSEPKETKVTITSSSIRSEGKSFASAVSAPKKKKSGFEDRKKIIASKKSENSFEPLAEEDDAKIEDAPATLDAEKTDLSTPAEPKTPVASTSSFPADDATPSAPTITAMASSEILKPVATPPRMRITQKKAVVVVPAPSSEDILQIEKMKEELSKYGEQLAQCDSRIIECDNALSTYTAMSKVKCENVINSKDKIDEKVSKIMEIKAEDDRITTQCAEMKSKIEEVRSCILVKCAELSKCLESFKTKEAEHAGSKIGGVKSTSPLMPFAQDIMNDGRKSWSDIDAATD
jgi:hypothetical protein